MAYTRVVALILITVQTLAHFVDLLTYYQYCYHTYLLYLKILMSHNIMGMNVCNCKLITRLLYSDRDCLSCPSSVLCLRSIRRHNISFFKVSQMFFLKCLLLEVLWIETDLNIMEQCIILPSQWDSRDCVVLVLTEEPVLMWPVSKMVFQLYFIPQSPDMAAWQNDYLQVNPWDLWTFSSFNERVYFKIIKKMLI